MAVDATISPVLSFDLSERRHLALIWQVTVILSMLHCRMGALASHVG